MMALSGIWQPGSPSAPPVKGKPNNLQIIYESFTNTGAEQWQKWHFFEARPAKLSMRAAVLLFLSMAHQWLMAGIRRESMSISRLD